MATEITIDVAPDGSTTVSVKGVKGRKCKTLTAEFESGLGRVTHDTPTREMNEEEAATVKSRA